MKKILKDTAEEILKRLRDVELIIVYGSYAFGQMQRFSDIDMLVATKTKPRKRAIFRFVDYEGRKVLMMIHFQKFSDVLKEFKKADEWVWTYKAYMNALVLFDKDRNMQILRTELERHTVSNKDFLKEIPKSAPYLLEYVGKLKNAYLAKDELNVFYAARTIAKICYEILRPFNPVWKYTSEKETYASFIELENKPNHYVNDFKICYGLTLKSRSLATIYKSAMRLARETANFLRKKKLEKKIKDKEFLHFFKNKEYTAFLSSEL